MGNSSTGQQPTSCQILRRVASALTESRRRLYPSRCGYLLGTAGESLPQTKERAALRLPYPLGTPATMRRQALVDEAAAPGSGQALSFGNIYTQSNIVLRKYKNKVIYISGKFGARVIR